MTNYDIPYSFYGANKDAIECQDPECLVIGPAETGKTLACLWKLNRLAFKYPNASLVILRKTLTSTYPTVLVTYEDKILGENAPVDPYGGEKPQWYDYPNGSRVWIAGMDKSTRVLSAEHDWIFVNQPEELSLDEWETLTTRVTGRAGHIPNPQIIGDPNPSYPSHWMYTRDAITRFYSWHKDNPVLFDSITGQITAQGRRTMARLGNLTGPRRQRLLEGKAVQPEGAIYTEYSDGVHRVYAQDLPQFRRYVAGVDWGFRNPGTIGVYGLNSDDDMYLVVQCYHSRKRNDWWTERAKKLDEEFGIEAFACDPSEPAYIYDFQMAGLNAIAAFNGVRSGIDAVKQRLADRRLFFARDSLRQPDQILIEEKKPTCLEDEIEAYVWADKVKEQPVKEDDHGCDQMRYAIAYVDKVGEEPQPPKKKVKAWRPG